MTSTAAATLCSDNQIITDLLQLLEGVDGADLAGFLETEHRELLSLRRRLDLYECAVSELKGHLNHVFSAVGGLCALPMSATTRELLSLPKAHQPPGAHPERCSSAVSVPMTPISPAFTAWDPKSRPTSSLALCHTPAPAFRRTSFRIANDTGFRLQQPPRIIPSSSPPAHSPLSSASTFSAPPTDNLPSTRRDRAVNLNDHSMGTRNITATARLPLIMTFDKSMQTEADPLEDIVSRLHETVNEQRADIEDMEASLRERKAQVRTLRKQLRDKELRQYAVASDCVGLRRTESIMIETSGFLAQLRANSEWPQPVPPSPIPMEHRSANGAVWSKRQSVARTLGKKSRMSRIVDAKSLDSHSAATTPARSSGAPAKMAKPRTPVEYVNGWSVYEESTTEDEASSKAQAPAVANTDPNEEQQQQQQEKRASATQTAVDTRDSCIYVERSSISDESCRGDQAKGLKPPRYGQISESSAGADSHTEGAGQPERPGMCEGTGTPSADKAAAPAAIVSAQSTPIAKPSSPLPPSEVHMSTPSPQHTPVVRRGSLSSETQSSNIANCKSDACSNVTTIASGNNSPKATTPHLFRAVVSKTPRRIYSRLSNRLKRM
ncbi:hypothetical protein GQ54DRAFT_298075 [Martensiomyces pterosporus]|nr:hypothetical protein GQ54DRAFT_298075 [Martensiomyces pterosporus]